MLRPERMSKVSVTGSKPVMDEVIGTLHDLNLLHLSEYDGSWDGFAPGSPVQGAEAASEKLVTVRSLETILGVDADDAGPAQVVTEESLATDLEEIRQRANELDDRRDDLEDRIGAIEDEIDSMELFGDIGIDLDLLWGYDTLEVAVGEADTTAVERALASAPEVDAFETFAGERAVAVFARLAGDPDASIGEALVGVEFETVPIPEVEGTPAEHVDRLGAERAELLSRLDALEDEIDTLREEAAGFLLAAEETLTIEVQKTEAPLKFATTSNSFVAEGWIPTERYDDFVAAVQERVGDHVEIEELERASYSEHGHPEQVEDIGDTGTGEPDPTPAANGGDATASNEDARTDGGVVTMDDDPPTILDNPGPLEPMELLVETVSRPKYTEFDPTWLLFLTFPAFFGYMIGDVAYGLGYAGVGYLMMTRLESDGLRKLGGIGIMCGISTIIFGILYGEFLGLHVFGEIVWGAVGMDHPPIEKGLGAEEFAVAWMLITLFVGLAHVTLGHVLSFFKEYYNHGLRPAVFESGSWVVLMVGVWGWVFVILPDLAPNMFVMAFEEALPLAVLAHGLPNSLGTPMLGVIAIGTVMLIIGEGIKAVEILQVLVNVLSYLRLLAVLLAKAGMAFVVNLFVFGLYEHHGELHFATFGDPEAGHVIFEGLVNLDGGVTGMVGLIGGIVLLIVGHLIVFALGITSAGLQSIRLEYVEFFNKFYDGGGRTFNPFGYRRVYTTED